jgi:membrane-associated phospholipid phosphatase
VPRDTKAKYVLIWLFATSAIYFLVQFVVSHSYSFMTPVDNLIPFVPEFIWLYHTLIPVIIITTIFSMERRDVFFNTIVALTFAAVILSIFHIIFPSFYPREVIETSSISLWLVEITRSVDAPCNTFPSGHVTFSWIIYLSICKADCIKRTKWLRLTYLLWAVLIAASTLMLKQHYVFDVVSGLILAGLCVSLARRLRGRLLPCERTQQKTSTDNEAST